MHVLQLGVIAFKLNFFDLQLVSLGRERHAFRGTSCLEVTLAEESEGNEEAGRHEFVDVLAINLVESLPGHVNHLWIGYLHILVCQLGVQRHFFGEGPRHCHFCVFRHPVHQFQSPHIRLHKRLLTPSPFRPFQPQVI